MLRSRRIIDDRGFERTYLAGAHPDADARASAQAFEHNRTQAARMGPQLPRSTNLFTTPARDLARRFALQRLGSLASLPRSITRVLRAVASLVLGIALLAGVLIFGAAALGLVVAFLALCGVVVFLYAWSSPLGAASAVLACGSIIVALLAPRRLRIKGGPDRSGYSHLHARLLRDACPCCAYDYGDTPLELDGCRVCSECGSAWKPLPPDVGDEDDEHEYLDEQGRSLQDLREAEGVSALPDFGPPRPETLCEVLDLRGVPTRILPQRVPRPHLFCAFGLGTLATFPKARWLLLLMLVASLASVVTAHYTSRDPVRSWALLPGSVTVSLCLALFAARRVARYEAASRQAREWLHARTCLACEEPLTMTPTALRCGACGSVWAKPTDDTFRPS